MKAKAEPTGYRAQTHEILLVFELGSCSRSIELLPLGPQAHCFDSLDYFVRATFQCWLLAFGTPSNVEDGAWGRKHEDDTTVFTVYHSQH